MIHPESTCQGLKYRAAKRDRQSLDGHVSYQLPFILEVDVFIDSNRYLHCLLLLFTIQSF